MTTKYFDHTVEFDVDLGEWSTEELIDEIVDRGQEAIDDLQERFSVLGAADQRLVQNLLIAYTEKNARLFDMELKNLFKVVLGERIS